jgi:hypothetical protein
MKITPQQNKTNPLKLPPHLAAGERAGARLPARQVLPDVPPRGHQALQGRPRRALRQLPCPGEKDATLAQKLGQLQLQPFMAVFPQECMRQLAFFGPT